ncbi:efflux transporter periplasmic adaptor subunit [Oceanidesulfovibrio indonesiensis]|uniref:Efflux transporter periplasmic adaptor subunit n=1 Tax=Oceanidesulfovibrio indonesiensis TaxID=54767 RepID=A0A7M3MCH1_9BACT|nr:efflux RND transporter periplasmic adaptor subunit [Oceanidesulfovibrio indonesiensis]TVM16177.1 efflux transporter periplasmic adaptor subunit [Oceanidesulfovibrio indonesiensis]
MRTLLVLVLLAAVAGGGWWWYQSRHDAGQIRVLETEVLETGDVREVLEATGIIKSQVGAVVKIGVRATGEIVDLPYRVGDRVKKGQLIAAIDDRELRTQLDQALADLAIAEARAEYAEYDLARQTELYNQKLVDRDTLEEAEENARIRQAETERREAEVEAIRVRISYTRIFSPIDGVVSQVTAQEGETVVTGLQVANLITVLDPTRLEMWIYMDETDVGRVQPGQRVEFTVDAFPDRVFESRVEQIYPEPEIRDNIVYYQVLCPITKEQAELLRPEMTTQCRVIVTIRENVLALPNTALKWVGGEQAVFRSRGGANATVERITQETGLQLGLKGLTHSEVVAGLQPGDRVATQLVLPEQDTAPRGGGGR